MPWSDKFDEPIELPGAKKLLTLKDAIDHLGKTVPKAEHRDRKVLVAATSLANAAEGLDLIMHARIATLQALHRNDPPSELKLDRKDPHWGKRKLMRDQ
jgi:hypothetical protein